MMKKPVLVVGPFPPTIGGITTCILTIMSSNLRRKYRFIPFTTSRPTTGVSKEIYFYGAMFSIGLKNLFKSVIATFYHIIKFPFFIIIKKPDVIHIHTTDFWVFWESSIYIMISRLLRKKIILHIHATTFREFYYSGNFLIRSLIKRFLIYPYKIIVLSIGQKKFFKNIIDEKKLEVISNVVNIEKFNKSKYKNYESEKIKIVFIGGEEAKRKGIYDILKAINIISSKSNKISEMDYLFIFLGRCYDENIKKIINEYNINKYVLFLGYVKETDKIKFLNTSDIFVLPTYAEGLPIAMLEAMAAGLPIISTPVGSIPEIIKERENGYLVQPGDYKELAKKIMILSRDINLRKKMGKNNRIKVLDYDQTILTRKLSFLYE